MTLTPHVVRRPHLTEEDLRSFQLGGETSPLLFEIPSTPVFAPPAPTPKPSDVREPPKIEPVRPPTPSPSPTPGT